MIPVVMPTYARADVSFERGEGPYLFDAEGKRYLDFLSGIAVTGLGHGHPRVLEALETQARRVWHVSNGFRIPGQEKVARKLVDHTFADTVFFANSGVEAWECGAKLCRAYHDATGNPQRWRIITFNQAFHGRTLTAISAAKQDKLVKGFYPLVDGFDQVAFGNLNELRAAITDETAAICVEPVQGEGGIRAGTADFLRGLRAVCDEFGLLLYYDEIQTGMGRTGKLFAHEWFDAPPDVMCIAKGIGNGFPVGACLATEKAAAGMVAGTHGSTFGGNPLAMAVAEAVLDVILEPGFLERVTGVAERLRGRLDQLAAKHASVVTEVRGMGLMLGLRIRDEIPNTKLVTALRAAGLVTTSAGDNVVRLLPPLIIGDAEIEEGCAILDRVLAEARAS